MFVDRLENLTMHAGVVRLGVQRMSSQGQMIEEEIMIPAEEFDAFVGTLERARGMMSQRTQEAAPSQGHEDP